MVFNPIAYRDTFSYDTRPGLTGLVVANKTQTLAIDLESSGFSIYSSIDRRHGEYADSFGRPPTSVFEQYLNDNRKL